MHHQIVMYIPGSKQPPGTVQGQHENNNERRDGFTSSRLSRTRTYVCPAQAATLSVAPLPCCDTQPHQHAKDGQSALLGTGDPSSRLGPACLPTRLARVLGATAVGALAKALGNNRHASRAF